MAQENESRAQLEKQVLFRRGEEYRTESGEFLTVSRLCWRDFELLWEEILGILRKMTGKRREELCEKEDSPTELSIKGLVESDASLSLPRDLVMKTVSLATGRDEGYLAEHLLFDEVLEIFWVALRINFLENRRFRNFWKGVSSLFPPAPAQAGSEEATSLQV